MKATIKFFGMEVVDVTGLSVNQVKGLSNMIKFITRRAMFFVLAAFICGLGLGFIGPFIYLWYGGGR